MRDQAPFWLDPRDPPTAFPPVEYALRDPDGLLAIGGDLAPERLLAAYRRGIFPWYSEGQPILWWSPDPRWVLFPPELHLSRSLRKRLRSGRFEVTLDQSFDAVVEACRQPRPDGSGTWITDAMRDAYCRLHALGHAHSAETWRDGRLVGGLYGVAIGRVFFGESMFARESDASKVAFARLVRQLHAWGFALIDCQVHTEHLARFGARPIARHRFIQLLDEHSRRPGVAGPWRLETRVPDAE